MTSVAIDGAGLGLRRGLLKDLASAPDGAIDFMEVAPENWIGVGGRFGRQFRQYAERYPMLCHGLSLSLGGPTPLDMALVRSVRDFMAQFNVRAYTEHLSYTTDHGQLYDLMPIPFTDEAVRYVAERILRVQDELKQQIGIEHVSYYAAPGQEMAEIDFLLAVLEKADCGLLLDVNNLYVNGVNHGYDPAEYMAQLPGERIMYVHVAGHYDEAVDLKVDTHAAPVIAPVWALLEQAYERFGVMPTLLERDFNFPSAAELYAEVAYVRRLQSNAATPS